MNPACLLATLAVALLLAPLAGAADPEEDTAWGMEARTLDVRGHATGFDFTSTRDSALGADSITGGFDAPSARLTTALLTTHPEAASLRIDLAWTGLVEYRDTDGDGLYGLADETVQPIAVPALPQQTVVTPALGGGDVVAVTYTLPENETEDPVIGGGLPGTRGTLRLAFTLVPTPAIVDGTLVRPSEVGLDAEVRHFPFKAGDTRLALVAEVTTDAATLEPADSGVSAAAGRHSWQADWIPRVRVDGAEAPAGWSSLASDADRATAVLSMPRGEAVSQEGSVSAHRMSAAEVVEALRDLPPGDWRFYAIGLAGAALALGVPSLRRLKER